MTSFPKVLIDKRTYGDSYSKDCVFTHPEAIISLSKYGLLERGLSYLEPACGIGNLASILKQNRYNVTASDLMDWGYSDVKDIRDYGSNTFDVVITNPAYSDWEMFIRESLRIATKHVFLLFPNRYLEGQHRTRLFKVTNLTQVLVFAYRLKMYRPTGVELSSMTAYAWFHWDLQVNPKTSTKLDWLYR